MLFRSSAAKKRKGVAGKRDAEAPPATPDMAGAKKRAAPKAPKKAKKQPAIYEDDEDAPAPPAAVESEAEMRKRVSEALGRGGPNTRAKKAVVVKEEDLDEHELASLCGKVSGLDVKSAIDAGQSRSFACSARERQLMPFVPFQTLSTARRGPDPSSSLSLARPTTSPERTVSVTMPSSFPSVQRTPPPVELAAVYEPPSPRTC